jgi:hypothetical protein
VTPAGVPQHSKNNSLDCPTGRYRSIDAIGELSQVSNRRFGIPLVLPDAQDGPAIDRSSGSGADKRRPACQANPSECVREPREEGSGDIARPTRVERLAHPSSPLCVRLNPDWRVIDDPLQWVLQCRRGNPRAKNSGWESRFFLRTQSGLLAFVREHCGQVDPDALASLMTLPEWHR